jgi:hypothetical protein
MTLTETYQRGSYRRRNVSSSFSSFDVPPDSLKLMVWLAAAIVPWAAIYAFVHVVFGI